MKYIILILTLLFILSCDSTTNVGNTTVLDPWTKTSYWSENDWEVFGTGPRVFFEYAMLNIAHYSSIYDTEKGIMHIALPGETIKIELMYYEEDGSVSNQETKTIKFDYLGRITQWYDFEYSYNSDNLINKVEAIAGTYRDIRNYYYADMNISEIKRYSGDYLWDSLSFNHTDSSVTCIQYSTSNTLEFRLEDSLIYRSGSESGYVDSIVGWEYDNNNSTWSNDSSTVKFDFNTNGLLLLKDYGYTYWKYSYDINGKLDSVQIGDNKVYILEYDSNGNVSNYNCENVSKKEFIYDTISTYPLEKKEYKFNDADSTYYLYSILKIKRNL